MIKVDTTCDECGGRGKYSIDWHDYKCKKCKGTGCLPMTREEWLCSLSTEEKALWLAEESKRSVDDFANFDFKRSNRYFWETWLKEVQHDS